MLLYRYGCKGRSIQMWERFRKRLEASGCEESEHASLAPGSFDPIRDVVVCSLAYNDLNDDAKQKLRKAAPGVEFAF